MRHNLLLAQLSTTVHDATYSRVLRTIDSGIKEASDRLDSMGEHDNWEHQEFIVDIECDLVENLLGAAFVVCQTQINAVSSRAISMYKVLQVNSSKAFPHKPHELHAKGEKVGNISAVTGIVALANYFKHSSEWRHQDWSSPIGHAKNTIRDVSIIGLQPYSSGNLRTGAEWLGNSSYDNSEFFIKAVNDWAQKILLECALECRK